MKHSLLIGAVLAGLATPAVAQTPKTSAHSSSSVQSVYRTEREVEVRNSDGTVTSSTIVTRYYIFGYE